MKKFLLLGAAGLLLASCSQDELSTPVNNGDGNVRVTVKLPANLGTRAIGDGYASTALSYAVFDAGNESSFVLSGIDEEAFKSNTLSTEVNLNLVSGKTYNIAFFAQSPQTLSTASGNSAGTYTFNPENATISVDYTKMNSNDNLNNYYECFQGLTGVFTVGEENSVNLTATLTRPIAQVNWGTTDIKGENNKAITTAFGNQGQYITTTLVCSDAYTEYSVLNNDVIGTSQEVTLNNLGSPYLSTFPVDDTNETSIYTWVAMNYILAPQTSETVDFTLTVSNALNDNDVDEFTNDVVVANAPIQANYRTNIYGNLLSDNVSVTVTKDSEWSVPNGDYDVEIGMTEVTPNDEGNYVVTTQAELNWIANQVNTGANSFQDKTVLLDNDIYFTGNWTPIGAFTDDTSMLNNPFKGTFNGQGNTIYNLNVEGEYGVGLFGSLMGTVTDVNFDNAMIVGTHYGAVVVAYAYGNVTNCKVTNSTVILSPVEQANGTYDDGNQAAIILGYLGEEAYNVTGNTVENCNVTAYRDLGGIIGAYTGTKATVSGNTVTGLTMTIDNLHNYKGFTVNSDGTTAFEQYAAWNANPIVGRTNSSWTMGDNTDSDVTLTMGAVATDIADLASAAGQGDDVEFGGNITGAISSQYGYGNNKAAFDQNGGTINGNGYTLTVTGVTSTWDCAIYTTGGTIENLTVRGGFRSVFANYMKEDLIIKNCDLGGTYSINVNEAAVVPGLKLIVSGSTLNDWISYAGIDSASFTDCKFTLGSNNAIRPQVNTVLSECTFPAGWNLYFDLLKSGQTITFENCYLGTQLITLENMDSLFKSVELPSTDATLSDYVIVNNTVTE